MFANDEDYSEFVKRKEKDERNRQPEMLLVFIALYSILNSLTEGESELDIEISQGQTPLPTITIQQSVESASIFEQ